MSRPSYARIEPPVSGFSPRRAAVALAFGLLISSAAHGAGVRWLHTSADDDCPPPRAVACGALGYFSYFAEHESIPAQPQSCRPAEARNEGFDPVARVYSPPPAAGGAVPCADGRCLERTPEGSDVLVVDWDGPHGWSVAGTIHHIGAGDLSVGLLDLRPEMTVLGYQGVGDAEVITQLCRIADMAREDRPLTVNMSFGRKPEPSFIDIEEPGSSPESLPEQLQLVLRHLRQDLGILLIGAAGNHGEMILPARSSSVLSAGALDLSAMGRHELALPSAETPEDANFLLPGYGLFLETEGGVWAAPPGSSYSAAIASGWLTRALLTAPAPEGILAAIHSSSRFTPVQGALEIFELELDGQTVPGSRLTESHLVLGGALGALPELCTHDQQETSQVYRVGVSGTVNLGISNTPDDLQVLSNLPNPESEPCVPCHDLPGGPSGGRPDEAMKAFDPVDTLPTSTVVIDFSRSQGIDTETQELRGLYLSIDRVLYGFGESTRADLLQAVSAGASHIGALEIANLPPGAQEVQMSLVFHLRSVGNPQTKDLDVLLSVPVTVHGH